MNLRSPVFCVAQNINLALEHNVRGETCEERETAGSLATLGMTTRKTKALYLPLTTYHLPLATYHSHFLLGLIL
ncbi:hypothetical protein AciX8_0203 [Granulicella mallensis MP5ACTX8]|uniref:Uncharacterized protein n=1 Tax=Granulicella mallensis (strain ATCC BAA-1857 / DSM 23137 / MP5ACTX8) TaxID=682795 RepID=G8NZT4_GRAMM|nr:hypothetical protein AciX8_0203 [Granulicella mallensis MP5ACTX8]